MNTEQTTVRAIVRSLEGNSAHVEVEHGGCGRCHEKGGCGGQQLTQMFCAGPKAFHVENDIGAGVGDRVVIAIAPGSIRRIANFAYIFPLTVTIGGGLLGASLGGDLNAMIGAGIGLCASFLYVIIRSHGNIGNLSERPHIISRS